MSKETFDTSNNFDMFDALFSIFQQMIRHSR